jgi:hypothetical protein
MTPPCARAAQKKNTAPRQGRSAVNPQERVGGRKALELPGEGEHPAVTTIAYSSSPHYPHYYRIDGGGLLMFGQNAAFN